VPILAGNRIDVLHNGDEFYPVMLEDIGPAQAVDHDEAHNLLGREIGRRFAEALAAKAREGIPGQDPARCGRVGHDRARRFLETLEKGGCQLALVQPHSWYTIGQFNHRTHIASPRSSTAASGFTAVPALQMCGSVTHSRRSSGAIRSCASPARR
jgi:cardiolipin synthase